MKKINLKKINEPIKISQIKYFDNRGYFQEIFLKKFFSLNIKFTAIAKSKKRVMKGGLGQHGNLALSPGEFPGEAPDIKVDEGGRLSMDNVFFKYNGPRGGDEYLANLGIQRGDAEEAAPEPVEAPEPKPAPKKGGGEEEAPMEMEMEEEAPAEEEAAAEEGSEKETFSLFSGGGRRRTKGRKGKGQERNGTERAGNDRKGRAPKGKDSNIKGKGETRTARKGTARHGTARHGRERNGKERKGTERKQQ